MQRTVENHFTSLFWVYIFYLNLCGEQQTLIYKKRISP